MNYAKGYEGARWLASDENNDTLLYRVEIRGVKESAWKLLKENVKERYFSWDTGAFPDGEYVLRVTASDSPSNPPQQALDRIPGQRSFLDRQHAAANLESHQQPGVRHKLDITLRPRATHAAPSITPNIR